MSFDIDLAPDLLSKFLKALTVDGGSFTVLLLSKTPMFLI